MKFKAGDIVKNKTFGTGVVVGYNPLNDWYYVEYTTNIPDGRKETNTVSIARNELELVEEEKGTIEKLGKTIDDAINESPVCMGMVAGLNKTIEDLKIELKNKQSRIDYLEGQISVYKKYMFSESEEN